MGERVQNCGANDCKGVKGRASPFGSEAGKVRNRRISPVAPRPREGLLTEPLAGVQPRP